MKTCTIICLKNSTRYSEITFLNKKLLRFQLIINTC